MDQNFSWVKARHACSPFEVFQHLQLGCESDVVERNAVRRTDPPDPFVFKVRPYGDTFLVLREGQQISSSVGFSWNEKGILVRRDATILLQATLTLNDDGECRLKVGAEELTEWQFRKRALEALLFQF